MLREAGEGTREAARHAGYAAGVPSEQARAVAAAAVKVRNNPHAAEWIDSRIAKLEAELITLRELRRAARLLQGQTVLRESHQEAA